MPAATHAYSIWIHVHHLRDVYKKSFKSENGHILVLVALRIDEFGARRPLPLWLIRRAGLIAVCNGGSSE